MDKLPVEILIQIANHIEKLRATCRLLNTIAEPAMLTREIDISTIESAWSFYDYITKNTSKGQLVKHLNFGEASIATYELYKRIASLILNPNIETLRGWGFREDFYTELNHIIAESSCKCSKLKILPHRHRGSSTIYDTTTLLFKDTLQDIFVDGANRGNLIEISQTYPRLNSIAVSVNAEHLDILDTISQLENVRRASLYVFNTPVVSIDSRLLNEQSSFPVLQQHHLNSITINTDIPVTIPLVLNRFTQLREVNVYSEVSSIEKEIYNKVMDALDQIAENYECTIYVHDGDDEFTEMINDSKRKGIIVSSYEVFEYGDPSEIDFQGMSVTLKKDAPTHHIH
ncbi:hypothetical protein MBANPS3_002007 [Mucor bainieri]